MSKLKDEVGNIYGLLTVIERAPNNKDGRAMWKCKCSCGNEVIVLGKHLRSGNTKSCGCFQKQRAIESNLARGGNLAGKRFGKLVAIEEAGYVTGTNGKRRRLWLCKCDCGNYCKIQHQYLAYGDTNSCGCISSIGNMTINRILNKSGYKYKAEYSFPEFKCNTGLYRYDFGLLNEDDELIGLIEYQGDIHFTYNNSGWNTEERLKDCQKRDQEKFEYCQKNNIKLYYITYKDDIEERLEEIINELYCK